VTPGLRLLLLAALAALVLLGGPARAVEAPEGVAMPGEPAPQPATDPETSAEAPGTPPDPAGPEPAPSDPTP
jgi:hypothetical protein